MPSNNRTITALVGCEAGHFTSPVAGTGATAILFPEGAFAGYVIPGNAACTRQLTAMAVGHPTERVHGFCLSGGSGFGLGAADGVMAVLRERGIGFKGGLGPRIPVVPAASLFDGTAEPPGAAQGRYAAVSASALPLPGGRVGAGTGACCSPERRPSGLGNWAIDGDGWCVAACSVANAYGYVRDPETSKWLYGAPSLSHGTPDDTDWNRHTTLSVIVTDAPLHRVQLNVVARMASAALARAIYPAFAPFDGDCIFAASTAPATTASFADNNLVAAVGSAAADCLVEAILRACDHSRAGA